MLKFIQKYSIPLGGGLLIVIIALSVISAPAIKRQLNAWKLLPQPERLTELYFTNHLQLPTTYTPGASQSFSFTVHNLEYRTTHYDYKVVELSEAGTPAQTLSSGSFSLQQNQYQTKPVNITTTDLGPRAKVAVQLTNQNESIDYWVTRQDS